MREPLTEEQQDELAKKLAITTLCSYWLDMRRRENRDERDKLAREASKLPTPEYVALLARHDAYVEQARDAIYVSNEESYGVDRLSAWIAGLWAHGQISDELYERIKAGEWPRDQGAA